MSRSTPAGKACLLLSAIVVILALGEAALRVAGFGAAREMNRAEGGAAAPGTYRILTLGESTTAPAWNGHCWPSFLEETLNKAGQPPVQVINVARPGITSVVLLGRLPGYLDKYAPQMVIAMIGANDGEWFGVVEFQHGWRGALERLKLWKLLRYLYFETLRSSPRHSRDEQRPDGPQSECCRTGEALLERSDFDALQRVCSAAIERDARDACAYELLASLRFSHPKAGSARKDAEPYFLKALELGPTSIQPYFGYAMLLKGTGREEDAIRILETAIRRFPMDVSLPSLYRHLGDLYHDVHRDDSATAMYNAAIASEDPIRARRVSLRAPAPTDPPASKEAPHVGAVTAANYRTIRDLVLSRGIKLVVMQYPTEDVGALERILGKDPALTFVGNKANFEAALAKEPYKEYFIDRFGGQWGHCTAKGDRLIADGLAPVIRGIRRQAP